VSRFVRWRGHVIVGLTTLAFVLAVANLVKADYLTWDALAARRDALAAAASIVTTAVLLTGAVLSYFRFFRGRTLSVRAEISLIAIPLNAPDGRFLHTLTLQLKNVGSMAIWDPVPRIAIHAHTHSGVEDRGIIEHWYDPLEAPDGRKRIAVVDAGETAQFFTHQSFPPTDWAVTYIATVTCDTGDVWKCASTVANGAPAGPALNDGGDR
jgi:hypothetical protein